MNHNFCESWGKYPYFPQSPHRCKWRNELPIKLDELARHFDNTLPYGNGRSYGDSCLATSDNVIGMSHLNKIISADWSSGVIRCEAGITFEDIIRISIPNGWFLPVTPGTKFVTLGGAVANDVHGKNHQHRGSFGGHVIRFSLIRSDQPEAICSANHNSHLFSATIGGLGLTGIIKWVEIQLMPISSSQIKSTIMRFNSLNEFFELSQEHDHQYQYSAAWIDCLAKGDNLGRGVYFFGDHADDGPLAVNDKKRLSLPFASPVSAINPVTLKLFNALYFAKHSTTPKTASVEYDAFFYPLDGVLRWNRIYGKKGFQQYQCVIPEREAYATIKELLRIISDCNCGSFLVVLKRCGNIPSPGLLSFPMPGISLALDFPQNKKIAHLFYQLDIVVAQAKGRLYPAKDAHMKGENFRQAYPHWHRVEALRDPALQSRFWQRVIEQ